MASAPFSTAAWAQAQSPAGASNSGTIVGAAIDGEGPSALCREVVGVETIRSEDSDYLPAANWFLQCFDLEHNCPFYRQSGRTTFLMVRWEGESMGGTGKNLEISGVQPVNKFQQLFLAVMCNGHMMCSKTGIWIFTLRNPPRTREKFKSCWTGCLWTCRPTAVL